MVIALHQLPERAYGVSWAPCARAGRRPGGSPIPPMTCWWRLPPGPVSADQTRASPKQRWDNRSSGYEADQEPGFDVPQHHRAGCGFRRRRTSWRQVASLARSSVSRRYLHSGFSPDVANDGIPVHIQTCAVLGRYRGGRVQHRSRSADVLDGRRDYEPDRFGCSSAGLMAEQHEGVVIRMLPVVIPNGVVIGVDNLRRRPAWRRSTLR